LRGARPRRRGGAGGERLHSHLVLVRDERADLLRELYHLRVPRHVLHPELRAAPAREGDAFDLHKVRKPAADEVRVTLDLPGATGARAFRQQQREAAGGQTEREMKHDCVYSGRDLVHVPVADEREAKDSALALAREGVHALEEALPKVGEQRAVDLRAPPPRD
jgi:hypothetical protein